MRRTVILAAALLASSTAWADGRGQAIFSQRCARCHVVGQGAPTNELIVDVGVINQAGASAGDHDA